MAWRLKPFIPNMISSEQGGFVKGKQILVEIVMAQEVIHIMFKHK